MIYFIWLSLLAARSFIAQFADSTILAVVVTFLLFFDFLIIKLKNRVVESVDFFFVLLIIAAIPFRNFVRVFDMLLAVYLLRFIPIDKILFIKFFVEVFCILGLFFCLYTGRLTDVLRHYSKTSMSLHSYGFLNSNVAALFFFQFNITLLLLWKRFQCPLFLLVSIVIDYIIYMNCYGRTYHYGFLIIVFFMIVSENSILEFLMRKYCKYIGLLCIVMTFVLPVLAFTNSSFAFLQSAFTSRFFFFFNIIGNLSLKNIFVGLKYTENAPLDSSFLYLFLDGGIFYVLLFLNKYRKAFDSNELIEHADLPLIIGYSIAGFTESFFVGVTLTSVIFWMMLLNKKK